MPKLKTNKAASKRFRVTASGKLKRSKANGNHILTKKRSKRKAKLKKAGYVESANEYRMKRLLRMA